MKLLGFWSGHDCSFCVLNNGQIELHTELERHLREKEPAGDSIGMFYTHDGDTSDVIGIATCHSDRGIKAHADSWNRIESLNVPLYVVGHHQSHASNAFYSSNFDEALSITIDGGGIEDKSGTCVGASIWHGKGNKIDLVHYFPIEQVNIGGVWSRVTRHVFKYESGWPFGNQAGTTMALAALAKDYTRFVPRFRQIFEKDLAIATMRAPGHVVGMSAKDPANHKHPYLNDLAELAENDEQTKYDIAGALQFVTEEKINQIVEYALSKFSNVRNVCFSGGVALNSVALGKIVTNYNDFRFYVPPVPYDAGLTIGAAQYAWHHILGNPRVIWNDCASPYLGKKYTEQDVFSALSNVSSEIVLEKTTDDVVLDLLASGNIVSVFNDRAESGRRALGNRSILADPRNESIKDTINFKVKSRQWFRPFAPAIPEEFVLEWFTSDADSPYMNFVLQFREEKKQLVPAVVHFDGTGRLQTVTSKRNSWFHTFLLKWKEKSGVPILLNTSYNLQEPIVETPEHAVNCFLKTKIDFLYFVSEGILVSRKKNDGKA
jgi:carbamoyltransferase